MCIWIEFHCLVKGFENQWIVIAFTDHIGHDTPVTEIQNGAQIKFVNLGSLVPLEFGHIGKPLLVWLLCIKLSVQKVLSKILWVLRLSGTATVVIFHGRTDISGPTDTKHPFVIDIDPIVMTQIVIQPSVSLIWVVCVNLFEFIRKALVFCIPLTQFAGNPFVIGRTCHMKHFTGQLNRIVLFSVCFTDDHIDMALSYF